MLEVKNMVKTFFKGTINEKTALQGIDLRLEEGDFCTVIGGNGAGKSTLLNSIAGVFPVDEGSITINDIDVTKMPEYKRANYIGRVFQDPMVGTAGNMQIEENLILAMRRGKNLGYCCLSGIVLQGRAMDSKNGLGYRGHSDVSRQGIDVPFPG